MLEYEWRELETLCERISDLRDRHSFALRSRNVGLSEGLNEDIARVKRQREQLVHHISACLGSAAAEGQPSDDAAPDTRPDDAASTRSAPEAASADSSEGIVGFSSGYASTLAGGHRPRTTNR